MDLGGKARAKKKGLELALDQLSESARVCVCVDDIILIQNVFAGNVPRASQRARENVRVFGAPRAVNATPAELLALFRCDEWLPLLYAKKRPPRQPSTNGIPARPHRFFGPRK